MTAKRVLDCSNFGSALQCLADVVGFSTDELRAKLSEFEARNDLDVAWEETAFGFISDLGSSFERIAACFSHCLWFHETRAVTSERFLKDGLLSHPASKDVVWASLVDMFPEEQERLAQLCAEFDSDAEYELSPQRPETEGPDAFLFSTENGSRSGRNYLEEGSEIAEDVLREFDRRFHTQFRLEYLARTRPLVVCFEAEGVLPETIRYVVGTIVLGRPPSPPRCFEGRSEGIEASKILRIHHAP
jgi:hypothetical protein